MWCFPNIGAQRNRSDILKNTLITSSRWKGKMFTLNLRNTFLLTAAILLISTLLFSCSSENKIKNGHYLMISIDNDSKYLEKDLIVVADGVSSSWKKSILRTKNLSVSS